MWRLMLRIDRHTLDNGLRIVHSRTAGTQLAAVDVLYRVGSRDEDEGRTGLAHLLEHLMFNGSRHVDDFSSRVQDAAGECNAWTNCDVTNYYMSLPSCNIETAFWLESDRMAFLNLDTRSIKTQKEVVAEEFKQRVCNAPYGDIGHILRGLCYERHPYRWPTIGRNLEGIEALGEGDVRAFHDAYYSPSNAILSVVGDIPFETVVGLAEKWFGGIAPCDHPAKAFPAEERQRGRREVTVERNVPVNTIYMAFPMCGRLGKEFHTFDMVSDILSNGKSSRIVNNLVKRDRLFSSIDAYIDGCVDPGLFHIDGKMNPGVDFDLAERKIREEIAGLLTDPITEDEMAKVRNKFESNFLFSNLNNQNLAYSLAYYDMLGDAGWINDEVEAYDSTTARQIADVISGSLTEDNSCVVRYKAKQDGCHS